MKYIFQNRFLAVFAVIILVVTNCGFKGPLYLPKKPAASAPAKNTSSSTKTASSAIKIASSGLQNIK